MRWADGEVKIVPRLEQLQPGPRVLDTVESADTVTSTLAT